MEPEKKNNSVYIREQVKTRAKIFAVRIGMSFSKLVETALIFYIANYKKIKSE